MFDHVKFGVRDYAASKAFYLQALEPLGVTVGGEGVPSYGIEICGSNDASLCLFETGERTAPLHIAFVAQTRAQVDAFHRAALAAGCDAEDLATRWLDRVGPMSLVWGSDWPCTAHEQAQATSVSPTWLARWLPSDAMSEVVLTDNALSLYGF